MIDQPELTLEVPLATKEEEPVIRQFPSIQEFAIRHGILHLIHTSPVPAQNLELDWEAIQLSLMDLESDGTALIHLSAQIPEPQPSSTLTLEGTMTLLEKEVSSLHQEDLSGFPAVEVQGQLEVSQFHLGRLVQFLRRQTLEKPISTRANIQGNLSYIYQQENDLFSFRIFQISFDEWSFSGQGSIANVLHMSPNG